jgi:hypothetical protein
MANDWIDVHGHFNVIALRPPGYDPKGKWEFSPATSIDFMDRTGVAAQLLSNYGPQTPETIIAANSHGAALVAQYPERFGLLAQLPLSEPEKALAELRRGVDELDCEGFAIQSNYNGIYLGDPRFEPIWTEFDRRRATLFIHPTPLGYEDTRLDRPGALVEAPFDTARTVVDMLYAGVFRRHKEFQRDPRPCRWRTARARRPSRDAGALAAGLGRQSAEGDGRGDARDLCAALLRHGPRRNTAFARSGSRRNDARPRALWRRFRGAVYLH